MKTRAGVAERLAAFCGRAALSVRATRLPETRLGKPTVAHRKKNEGPPRSGNPAHLDTPFTRGFSDVRAF
jgi:hypothetical protein